jgi:glycosyltransferase involved in cell wall biosynthesis
MRVALLQPCYWPEVRRGTERVVHDLGAALAQRGHDVSLITSHPGPGTRTVEDGVTIVRTRRPRALSPLRWYEDHLSSVPSMTRHLLAGRYDVAHAFHPAYAWGAVKARRLGGPPVVFSFHGIPERGYLVRRRYRLEMLQTTVAGADAVTVLSETAAEVFERYLLRRPTVLPGGVVASEFGVNGARRAEPTLISAASLGDPRKRGDLLLSAFSRLRDQVAGATLRLVRTPDPFLSPAIPSLPDGAEWIDADATPTLAHEYAAAHASVLPSVGEAFGLVVLESLAAGTPAVAIRGGASAELIEEGVTGETFAADAESELVDAMHRALELGSKAETAAACRTAAEPFDWQELVVPHEALYEEALRDGGHRT